MYGQMPSLGFKSYMDDMKKEDLQSPLYGQQMQQVSSEQLKMPEFGSGLQPKQPSLMAGGASESASSGLTQSQATMGKAGIDAAATLLGSLMKAKAEREKGLRERKAEGAKTVAESTQRALQSQMAATANPLANLIGAYRSVV